MFAGQTYGELTYGEAPAAPVPPAISQPPLGLSNAERAGRRILAIEIEAGSLAAAPPPVPALIAAATYGQLTFGEDAYGGGGGVYVGAAEVLTIRAADHGFVAAMPRLEADYLSTEAGIALLTEDGVPIELEQQALVPRAQPWRPTLLDGITSERQVDLSPAGTGAGASWGTARLANADQGYSALVGTYSPTARPVRLRWGYQTWDATRAIYTDPPLTETAMLWSGLAAGWSLGETTLDVALRDAGYWLERPLQGALYGGTGGLDGTAELAGQPIPKLRGGNASNPVRHITPVLVDPVARIYQISDARAVVVALYEGGDAANITFQADVSDLYAGSTNVGQYRTDSARGLIQLGRAPARPITVDAWGDYPTLASINTPARMAYALLLDDCGISPALVDFDSFAALDGAWPHVAGWHWAEPVRGWEAVGWLLRSCGAHLITRRDGRLATVSFLAIGTPRARYSDADIVSIRPIALPAELDPPPYRFRAGYARCHTLLTSDLDPDVTEAGRQFLATEDRLAGWVSTSIAAAYARPNDPAPVPTALLTQAGAQALANALGGCWGRYRRLYEVVLPIGMAARHEVGDTVILAASIHDLAAGRPGVIVGEGLRATEPTATLRVLV